MRKNDLYEKWLIVLSIVLISYLILMRSSSDSLKLMFLNILIEHTKVQLLTIGFSSLVFLSLIAIIPMFWIATGIYLVLVILLAVVNYEKFNLRNEGVLPSDLSMISSAGKLLSMVSPWIIVGVVGTVILIFLLSFVLMRRIVFQIAWPVKLLFVVLTAGYIFGLNNLQQKDSLFYAVGQAMGDDPQYYNQEKAVASNGPIINFFNNTNVKIMKKPTGYSKLKMKRIITKYRSISKKINSTRTSKKQTVIFILSESFSDPTAVPGVKLNRDPMPYTRQLMKTTTSGNMISDGYGGGTANMEYQALTGLSLGNFSATLPTPYSQLVVHQSKTFSFNNSFKYSQAIHPYAGTLYDREKVFKKMKFDKFNYLEHGYPKQYEKKLGTNPYVSDRASYRFLISQLKTNQHDQFIQLSTMQNHMPYTTNYYENNQFKVSGKMTQSEKNEIRVYSKGVSETDSANKYLLGQLKKLKQNVTIVFYGDHLPSIYAHVNLNTHGIVMHETPYFIWSNHSHARKVSYQNRVGTYGFESEMLQAMNAKVTPYTALIQKINEQLPVVASKVSDTASDPNLPSGGMNLVDQNKDELTTISKLSKSQRELLLDYQLVQYDFTAGKHYALDLLTK